MVTKNMLIEETREAQIKAEELFNEGFDLDVLKNKKADKYRRKALNYGADLAQTLGAIHDMLKDGELIFVKKKKMKKMRG